MPLAVGIIGPGKHGSRYARHILSDLPELELAAIARRAEEGAAQAAGWNCRWHERWADLVDDPAVEAVIAAATPDLNVDIARACAELGITVVSGLALGVDTAAHRGALDGDGRTLAMLGSGIKHIHPRRNRRLAKAIREHGAVLSEQPPNASPSAARLMARNRLTSALARGVLAVESTLRGGTLQTARDAWTQGRLVFAVDWQADKPQAEGTRALIAQGAEPILGPDAVDLIARMLREHQVPAPDQPDLF